MTELPGKSYGAIQAWPEAGGIWRYLPRAPSPQLTPAGTPQFGLIDAGGLIMLTLGARLGTETAELAEARALIAAETRNGADIDLRPAEITVRSAKLALVAPGGTSRELARAAPSPVPPYPVALAATLKADAAEAIRAWRDSGSAQLVLGYDADLAARQNVTATLAGHCRDGADIEAALAAGDLRMTVEADDGASERLIADTVAEVKRSAGESLGRLAAGGGTACTSAVSASASRSEAAPAPLFITADIGNWLQGRPAQGRAD